jgi:type VI secretion system protein ImpE
MSASDLFKQGRLKEAIEAQLQEVKAKPGDHGKRLFLFELSAFAGDLDRARRQIGAVTYDDPEQQRATEGYRKLLDAEEKRRRLFRDGLVPKFLGEMPEHVKLRLEAVNRLREGRQGEAAELLHKANEGADALKGTLNGKEFVGLRDADDLFGMVLEVLAQGDYFWVPLEQLDSLAMNAPAFPRDLLWLPARLTLQDGQHGEVFLPTIYPGTHEQADDQVKTGRATDCRGADLPGGGGGFGSARVARTEDGWLRGSDVEQVVRSCLRGGRSFDEAILEQEHTPLASAHRRGRQVVVRRAGSRPSPAGRSAGPAGRTLRGGSIAPSAARWTTTGPTGSARLRSRNGPLFLSRATEVVEPGYSGGNRP